VICLYPGTLNNFIYLNWGVSLSNELRASEEFVKKCVRVLKNRYQRGDVKEVNIEQHHVSKDYMLVVTEIGDTKITYTF